MSWRPDDWQNGWNKEREYDGMSSDAEIFEAGADAMLEALKAKSSRVACGIYPMPETLRLLTQDKEGWLVFIPEEQR